MRELSFLADWPTGRPVVAHRSSTIWPLCSPTPSSLVTRRRTLSDRARFADADEARFAAADEARVA